MENKQQQGQQGLLGNNCAVPSSANCPAGPVLVSQVPFLHQRQSGLGEFPPLPPPSFAQQVSPYLTASVPQLSANLGSYASFTGTSGLQGFHQVLQSLPAYTIPPGPPNAGTASNAAAAPSGTAARSLPSASGGRQQSVSAVRPQDSTSDQRSSSVRRKKKSRTPRSRKKKKEKVKVFQKFQKHQEAAEKKEKIEVCVRGAPGEPQKPFH